MAPVRAPPRPEGSRMSHVVPHIVLSEEQARLVTTANEPVEVRDPNGNVIGRLEPSHLAEVIARCKRSAASPGPWYTGEQVQARLQALQEEWDRTGGFDQAYAHQFLE